MDHPAEIAAAMRKEAGFWAAIPWIMMALPFATQLIDRFRGGSEAGKDPFEQLQVPQPGGQRGLGEHAMHYGMHHAPDYTKPALRHAAQGLHNYRVGL